MRITIEKKALATLISRVKGSADPKSPIPTLGNIMLTAVAPVAALGQGTLTAGATDLYRASVASCECSVSVAGCIALPAKDLEDRVKAMPDGAIELDVDDTSATLRARDGKRRYALQGVDAGQFTAMPSPAADGATLRISAASLATLISRVAFSSCEDESRPAMNSALLDWHPGVARMVTTDGHRLSLADVPASTIEDAGEVLIQRRALEELGRLAAGADGELVFNVGPVWVFVDVVGGLSFAFKRVDGQFPAYQQAIPSSGRSVRVRREALIDALRAVAVAASDKTGRGVKLAFSPGTIKISAVATAGTGEDEIAAEYDGPAVEIGANASYLIEPLSAVADSEVEMIVGSALDPIKVEADDGRYVAVVMPMRV